MKRKLLCATICTVFLLATVPSFAQTTAAETPANQAASDAGAGANAASGTVTLTQISQNRKHSSVSTTPNVYMAPSMFGGQDNCGESNTLGVGFTGFGIGGSHASESSSCDAREDTAVAYKLGFKDVAVLRFFCFGSSLDRKAYEAAGHKCPSDATASGLKGAPTQPVAYLDQQKLAQIGRSKMSKTEIALRTRDHYWGNDPIVMARLGIPEH